jgi:glycosyltransferase involved in cell wall biosynthesis
VQSEFFVDRGPRLNHTIRLLFVGRLVPYKCADLVIEAMNLLAPDIRRRATLTIVGDGPERENLERSAQSLGVAAQVTFAGWVPQERTLEFYRQSDIFCFPSVREFGGAVVLEAMAAGLPCIVADYGGIAEYVTEGTGYRITLDSREHLRRQLTRHIEDLARDGELLAGMSARAIERAREFTWDSKARRTVNIYETLIERKYAKNSPQLAERGST